MTLFLRGCSKNSVTDMFLHQLLCSPFAQPSSPTPFPNPIWQPFPPIPSHDALALPFPKPPAQPPSSIPPAPDPIPYPLSQPSSPTRSPFTWIHFPPTSCFTAIGRVCVLALSRASRTVGNISISRQNVPGCVRNSIPSQPETAKPKLEHKKNVNSFVQKPMFFW